MNIQSTWSLTAQGQIQIYTEIIKFHKDDFFFKNDQSSPHIAKKIIYRLSKHIVKFQ